MNAWINCLMIGELRFTGEWPIAVGLVALAGALLVFWAYSGEAFSLKSPYNYLLPALRATAVILTILLLAEPVWHMRQEVGTLGRVVFAIDTSKSMSVTDSGEEGSSPNRMRRALSLLLGDDSRDGWLQTLKDSHNVDVISFSAGEPSLLWSSGGEEPMPTSLDLMAEGKETDLSVGLRLTLDSVDPNQTTEFKFDESEDLERAAFVMLSDGRDNTGDSAVDLAKQLQSQSMTAHTVGMGSRDEPADVGIVNIVRPESVASDGELAGTVVLKQFGMSGNPCTQIRQSCDSTRRR